ncbi:hypothetical protein [Micromonospora sp. DT227]
MGERTDDTSPGEPFLSAQDIEDADILLAYPPRRVVRLVKAVATRPDEPR